MSSHPLTAGVVGAGVAGLSAAIALRRAGFEVQVYERSQFKNEIGAAISAPPNATAVLRRWGFDFVAAETVPNLFTRYAAAADLGAVLFESRYEDIEAVMGSPSLSFHRVDLHNGLRALATEDEGGVDGDTKGKRVGGSQGGKGTPVAIRLGCEVRGVDCDNGVLVLADGTRVQKDLVIIADGAHVSQVLFFSALVCRSGLLRLTCRKERPFSRLSRPPGPPSAYGPLDLSLARLHGRSDGGSRACGAVSG